jgi:PAS domain S-box-containing protein
VGADPGQSGFFQALVEAVPEAIIVSTPAGEITYLNPAAERLLGYSSAEVAGSNIVRLVPPQADRRADPVKWLARWAAEPEPEQSRRLDFQARRKDGRELTVEVRVIAAPIHGEPRFVITFRDITQRRLDQISIKENNLRAARILMIAEDAIVSCDADQNISFFNLAAEAMFGCRAEDVLGHPLSELLPPAARAHHPSLVKAFGQGSAASRMMSDRTEVTGLRRNGEVFPLDASITKVETGDTVSFTAHLRDITRRKAAEARLQEQERRLHAVFDNVTDAIALLQPDGAIVEINEAAMHLTDGAEAAPHGKRLWELAWGTGAPTTLGQECRLALKSAIEAAASGKGSSLEAQIGDHQQVEIVVTPVLAIDKTVEFIIVEGRAHN